jgi:arginine-tRNA-protein transferase
VTEKAPEDKHLQLFATHPHPCSYLPDLEATTIFIDPEAEIDINAYSQLSESGFRRSGTHIYRPHCEGCQACISVRVPVKDFTPTRNQKRCLKQNSDLDIVVVNDIDTDEHYQLYQHYIDKRHRDGDMYPASREQYQGFLGSAWGATRYLEMRLDGVLIGVAVSDQIDNALSAIYTFFDCAHDKRSLGRFAVLHQIERAKTLNLDYLYLGYWIKQCDKMSYKSQYRPLEVLVGQEWLKLN